MPTENRSSNTEMVSAAPAPKQRIYVEVRECEGCNHIGIDDAHKTLGACHECDWSGPEPVEDKCPGCGRENVMAAACPDCGSRYVLAASKEFEIQAPQPHPEPMAWMVGTSFWWTKEEAERDAAETGLPIVGLGPMTGTAPAEQQQGEPVAWLAKILKGSLAGTLGLARYDQRLNPELYDGPFPVFRHADPGEVERLREGIAKHWKVVCDQRAEIESLRDQLAKVVRSGALTAPEHEALEAECCALSATAEPSTPAAQA